MTLKTALVAPTPRASESTAVTARPGRRRNSRAAYRKSEASLSIHGYIRPDLAMVTEYFCSLSPALRGGRTTAGVVSSLTAPRPIHRAAGSVEAESRCANSTAAALQINGRHRR